MLIADCLLQVSLLMPAHINSTSSELQIQQLMPPFVTDQLISLADASCGCTLLCLGLQHLVLEPCHRTEEALQENWILVLLHHCCANDIPGKRQQFEHRKCCIADG